MAVTLKSGLYNVIGLSDEDHIAKLWSNHQSFPYRNNDDSGGDGFMSFSEGDSVVWSLELPAPKYASDWTIT